MTQAQKEKAQQNIANFFEWGFKAMLAGAAAFSISYMKEISTTMSAIDSKFGVAIAELKVRTNSTEESVKDIETRLRVVEKAVK